MFVCVCVCGWVDVCVLSHQPISKTTKTGEGRYRLAPCTANHITSSVWGDSFPLGRA